jgi:2-polyprenyl-3-methyl-5-hydroxy-6-metoxy-1,4-benzoquinol methylase
MFNRKDQTYIIGDETIDRILCDPAQPLGQIATLLPDNVTVLDIGAGNGMLGRVLQRAGKKVTIDAIEPSEFAAKLAQPFYRSVYQGYAQDYLHIIQTNRYDYIILADVIEHIPDPSTFLTDILHYLPDTTNLIISLPNIAFGGVRLALLNGSFDYVDSGLLERTHLRFFTLASATQLFNNLKLYPKRVLSLERSFYRMEFSRKLLSAMPFTILNLALQSDARAYQYLFLLSKTPSNSLIEHHGTSTLNILIDAVVARPSIKKLVKRWRNH